MSRSSVVTAIDILKQRFGDQLSTVRSVRQHHSHTTTQIKSQLPDAVLFAKSTADVAAAVAVCREHHCPIIPFGVGSSLEGHVNAPKGGLSIDLNAMDKVLAVHATDLDAVVQPGVTREALNNYLRDTGLFFPIDPGANASLGGMSATRASGTNAVRYGTMKDNILALEAVMADGTVIRTGSRAKKSSAGYDLTRLLIGSEGTLGLITELTVKLHGIPEMIAGGICSFPSIEAACNAVITTIQYGIPVARIELLDAVQVRACNLYSGLDLPEETLLLLEFHGTENSVREQSEIFGEIAAEHTPHPFKWTTDPDERTQLWKARHDAFWAALALLPGGVGISTDVCVPISRLAECVEDTRRDIEASGIISPIVGHVGDGNFHTLPIAMPDDDATWARIKAFSERLSERAIAMGGTCTGEHGIGQGKIDYLRQEMGPAVDVMMAVKQALDPHDILNPGKLFNK
ncbi:FAD-binding protein [Alphaproteobacteria bacterium]|nr:FAD-binding protein [Alphaproteobacteria bacterium]MDC1120953.1 FAD-linked oxidase C-terminal domain-containing protein [Alphaproteobacteria bacterium]